MGSEEKVNILLVDDRWENLVSLKAVLDAPSYNLVKACSGREALRELFDRDFALILLDVQMPILDGFETATLIKSRERSKDIPIIFVTGLSTGEPFVFKGYGAGAVDYICKPFDPSILRSKVAVFADLYRKKQQIERQAQLLREAEIRRVETESLRRERAAHQRFKELLEGITNAFVWAADPESLTPTALSHQIRDIAGYTVEESTRDVSFWKRLLHRDDLRDTLEGLRKLQCGEDMSIVHRFIKSDGSPGWLHTRARLVCVAGLDCSELRGMSVDITPLKLSEEALESAVRVRDEFLSIASHELKTPLTPLKLQIQTMARYCAMVALPPALHQKMLRMLDTADRQVSRLNRLVDELLDVARISNGKLELETERLNLTDVVVDVCQRFSVDLERAGSSLEVDAESSVTGQWDRMRMEQVLNNLISNAIRFADAKPIRVRLWSDESRAYISVQDEGGGIAPEDCERIFRRFERATHHTSATGLGLGLYIVRQILEAHGGSVSLESALKKGSTFTVQVPRVRTRKNAGMLEVGLQAE